MINHNVYMMQHKQKMFLPGGFQPLHYILAIHLIVCNGHLWTNTLCFLWAYTLVCLLTKNKNPGRNHPILLPWRKW